MGPVCGNWKALIFGGTEQIYSKLLCIGNTSQSAMTVCCALVRRKSLFLLLILPPRIVKSERPENGESKCLLSFVDLPPAQINKQMVAREKWYI